MLITGSAKWTNASENNQEVGVVNVLNAAGLQRHSKRIEEMRQLSEPFSEEAALTGIAERRKRNEVNSRARAKSMPSAKDRYKTAKKLGVAESLKFHGQAALGNT